MMHILTRKHLAEAMSLYPDAAGKLQKWFDTVKKARWRNFLEVQHAFQDADRVDEFTIFNIRHNRYRLITIIHHSRDKNGRITEGHIYIRSFLSHREYDNRANWNQGASR